MTPNQASMKVNEKAVYSNLIDKRGKQKPKSKLGDLVRISDIKSVFTEGDSKNYSIEFYTLTDRVHETIQSDRINYLPERYNQNLLLPTKLSADEIRKVMQKLNLFQ